MKMLLWATFAITAGSAAIAQGAHPPPPHVRAACEAWREHIVHVADVRFRTGSLDRDTAETVTHAADVLAQRCTTRELRGVLRDFVLLLDLLQERDDGS